MQHQIIWRIVVISGTKSQETETIQFRIGIDIMIRINEKQVIIIMEWKFSKTFNLFPLNKNKWMQTHAGDHIHAISELFTNLYCYNLILCTLGEKHNTGCFKQYIIRLNLYTQKQFFVSHISKKMNTFYVWSIFFCMVNAIIKNVFNIQLHYWRRSTDILPIQMYLYT